MKILQLIHGLEMGGAETLVKDYCVLSGAETEMIVVILEPYCHSANEKAVMDSGTRIISISERLGWSVPKNLINKTYQHFSRKYFYSRELKKIINEEKPDVIHMHLACLKYLEPLSSDELKNIKLFYTCHNLPELYFSGKQKKEADIAQRLIAQNGLRLIALHPQMAEELNSMFGVNNTVVVRNGIDFTRFRNVSSDRKEVRKSLGIPEDAFVVGHVGRFVAQKNQSFLVDIFAELSKRVDNAFLLMVGSGGKKQEVLNKLKSMNLTDRYLCLENRGDIPELMNAMDIFVLPSVYEGLVIVLVEAQAVGLKCVISDTVSDAVMLTDHIFPVSLKASADEWCDVILDDKAVNTHISDDLEEYDMKNVMANLTEIYKGNE